MMTHEGFEASCHVFLKSQTEFSGLGGYRADGPQVEDSFRQYAIRTSFGTTDMKAVVQIVRRRSDSQLRDCTLVVAEYIYLV
jgi:hypothetical protein